MKKFGLSLALILVVLASSAFAQKTDPPKPNGDAKTEAASTIPAPPAITDKSSPQDLARAALAAMGGDNFKKLKSSYVVGSANLYAPNQAGSIPASFQIATEGEKVRVDFNAGQMGTFKQIYDGQRSATQQVWLAGAGEIRSERLHGCGDS